MTTMNERLLSMNMNDENTGNNPEAERMAFENKKYGRTPQPELAAHPHVYYKHSIEPMYGDFDAPIPPNSNVSV
jgi:hypothetical protein